MGGEAKAHAMYMRYWNLTKKKPPQPNLNKELPDLEELLQQAKEDGTLAAKSGRGAGATPKKGGPSSGRKRKGKSIKTEDSDDEEEDAQKKKSKATTIGGRKGSHAKPASYVPEEEDPERDAEGETDVEGI
jgi:hypothetical protein